MPLELGPEEFARVRARVMNLYLVVAITSLVAIAALLAYSIWLGTLLGPGVEESFGIALGLMFLFGALLVHVVDRAYREWPEGRRLRPPAPAPITPAVAAWWLKWAVVGAAAALIAYILAVGYLT